MNSGVEGEGLATQIRDDDVGLATQIRDDDVYPNLSQGSAVRLVREVGPVREDLDPLRADGPLISVDLPPASRELLQTLRKEINILAEAVETADKAQPDSGKGHPAAIYERWALDALEKEVSYEENPEFKDPGKQQELMAVRQSGYAAVKKNSRKNMSMS